MDGGGGWGLGRTTTIAESSAPERTTLTISSRSGSRLEEAATRRLSPSAPQTTATGTPEYGCHRIGRRAHGQAHTRARRRE